MKIRPAIGVAADLSSVIIILGQLSLVYLLALLMYFHLRLWGLVLHIVQRAYEWRTSQRMIITWSITLPISSYPNSTYLLFFELYFLIYLLKNTVSILFATNHTLKGQHPPELLVAYLSLLMII